MDITKSEERLRQVLIFDKSSVNIERVLKSDLLDVLNNYMDLNSDELKLKIDVDEFGFFEIKVNLHTWVKVKDNWRNKEGLIRNFGLD